MRFGNKFVYLQKKVNNTMSKAKLKKELQSMTREQLEQIILDAYDARTETKEYFEFFLNPDVPKLMAKFDKTLVKELNRMGWNTSKARVSVIKRAIKDFETLDPGPEAVIDILMRTMELLAAAEWNVSFTAVQDKFIGTLAQLIVDRADQYQMTSQAIERLKTLLGRSTVTRHFRSMVYQSIGYL